MVILVTGANGQLGQALKKASKNTDNLKFIFTDSDALDITNREKCERVFEKINPDFCINAGAYTAVDKAESDYEKAFAVNVTGVQNLAESCKKHDTTLIHISTDFVFDGENNVPYTEEDIPNPKSVYGTTKLQGEQEIQKILENYFIIRTSWVYSEFGNNFYKTMLRLASERDSLNVVNDQIGTPTNANCLAEAIIEVIKSKVKSQKFEEKDSKLRTSDFGIYNFSNEGSCSWYDFAKNIFELNDIKIELNPILTSAYPTPAIRPKYSVLDKSKIKTTFGIEIKSWEEALLMMNDER